MKQFLILILLVILALPVLAHDANEKDPSIGIMEAQLAAMGRKPPTEKQIADEHAAVAGTWELFWNRESQGIRIFTGRTDDVWQKHYQTKDLKEDLRYEIYWPSQTQYDRMQIQFTNQIGGSRKTFSYIFDDKDTMVFTNVDKDSERYGIMDIYKRIK